MDKLFSIKMNWTFVIFIFLDLICAGMGMGVPIFCILFGFVIGWYLARRISSTTGQTDQILMLKKIFLYAAITSAFTLVIMVIIWGRWSLILFDPGTNYENLGIPMILFDPKASFIGWQILMMVISPFLQFLTTIFGSYLTFVFWGKSNS